MDDDGGQVVALRTGDLSETPADRRIDRLESMVTESLKDILTKISLIADAQADIRDEVYRLGRDLISTRETVAAVDAVAMKRRKARK